MAAATQVRTLDYVARMLNEDLELLEAIVSNDDNLTHGAIISVYTCPNDVIIALTDHGVEELTDMLSEARFTTETWHDFLDAFVYDPELAARFKDRTPR